MDHNDLKGVRLPGSVAAACRRPITPDYPAQRAAFMDALADYIDAKIDYRACDPEWASTRDICKAGDQLEAALDALFKQ